MSCVWACPLNNGRTMTRYYCFGGITISVEGVPGGVPDGEYLVPFRSKKPAADLKIIVHEEKLTDFDFADRRYRSRLIELNGRLCIVSEFSHMPAAVVAALDDWGKPSITVTVNPEIYEEKGFTINQLLAISGFTSALVFRGCAVFHCSYVLTGNKALLFAGASGAGKSTQAALWERLRGARIINGDRAILFRRSDGWYAGGISVCGSSRICENRTAKIAAVIALEKGTDNRLLPMSVSEKYRTILAGMAFQRQSPEESERADRMAMEIISKLPIFRFYNQADAESVDVLEHEIRRCFI